MPAVVYAGLILVDIVRYVCSTAARGIIYGGKRKTLVFWCDANFAVCQETRRSTTGWVVTMYGGAVSWSSKKQATAAAASTMEAEYQACGAAAREGCHCSRHSGSLLHCLETFHWYDLSQLVVIIRLHCHCARTERKGRESSTLTFFTTLQGIR
jgi:hypothetical protein